MHEDILAQYDALAPALDGFRARSLESLGRLLEGERTAVLGLSGRLKSRVSLAAKLARPDKTYRRLWDVTDLVALRVVTRFEDATRSVGQALERAWRVDFGHSVDKSRAQDTNQFGYRSLHYVCAPAEGAPDPAFRFEVQVRTALQHAWAEVEHELGYKGTELPDPVRRRFNRIAGLLELADQEFVSLRDDLASAQAEAAVKLSEAVPLDAMSVRLLAATAPVRALDEGLARKLEQRLAEEVFFPDYLARMLRLAGLSTTSQVMASLSRHGDAVLALVEPYFAFASSAWQLHPRSLGNVLGGYSLFFLAHLEVLRGAELGISKVARLTRLYEALDYPADEATAHQVASRLLQALGG